MYRFELNNIESRHIGTEMLRMTENMCHDFGMENDFGIISTAMQQLLESIFAYTNEAPDTYSAIFTVDHQRLVIALQHELSMPGFEEEVLCSTMKEAEVLSRLADHIECLDGGRQLSVEFEIHPQQLSSAQENADLAQERQLTILEKKGIKIQ